MILLEGLDLAVMSWLNSCRICSGSSGMKQRLKLSLAFLTDSQVLLLDEPTSNFDAKAIDWYLKLIENYSKDRLVIVGSNQEYEYGFCKSKLDIMSYK